MVQMPDQRAVTQIQQHLQQGKAVRPAGNPCNDGVGRVKHAVFMQQVCNPGSIHMPIIPSRRIAVDILAVNAGYG